QHRREAVVLQLLERVSEIIDRIVGARPRAVAARIVDPEIIALEGLLRRLEPETQRLAVAREAAAARVGIQRKFGLGVFPPFGSTELRALALRFLVAGEQDDDVPVRLESFGAKLEQ